jgi:hypothetical protein
LRDGTAIAISAAEVAREVTMSRSGTVNENLLYWQALQASVCAICLDRRDDGSCGLPRGAVCALKRHLPLILDVVHNVDSAHMDDYVETVEGEVCRRCPEQDASGKCVKRDKASCALYTYLPVVVDAVEEEDQRRRSLFE